MGGGEILRRWFGEIWNDGKIETFPQLAAPDIVFHTVGPNSELLVGLDGFKTLFNALRASFSDIQFRVEETIESGDSAAVRWTCTMTHTGGIMGVAPTGKKVRITGMAFIRMKDGKAVESWDEWDRQGLMQQVGGQLQLAVR